jgi:hypothetical protein
MWNASQIIWDLAAPSVVRAEVAMVNMAIQHIAEWWNLISLSFSFRRTFGRDAGYSNSE